MARSMAAVAMVMVSLLLGASAAQARTAMLFVRDTKIDVDESRPPAETKALGRQASYQLGTAVKAYFSCLTVNTDDDVRQLVQFSKLKNIDFDEAAGAMGADYILKSTVTEIGQQYLVGLTLFDIRRAKVVDDQSGEFGLDAVKSGTAFKKLIEQLAESYTLCQYAGTVTFTRTIKKSTVDKKDSAFEHWHGTGTATTTLSHTEEGTETWVFEVDGKTITAKPKGAGSTADEERVEARNVACMGDRDDIKVFPTDDLDQNVSKSTWSIDRAIDLQAAAAVLSFTPDGTYSLALNAAGEGSISGERVVVRRNACTKTEVREPPTPFPYFGAVMWASPLLNGRRSEKVISHKHFEHSDDKTMHIAVEWNLRWKVAKQAP